MKNIQITKPTLLLNETIARRNISKMASKANNSNTVLRPHFKTHFSSEIAAWYGEAGVNCCTVSSVEMAKYFADNGWNDITIAFPFNRLELPVIEEISKSAKVNLVIEDRSTLDFLIETSKVPLNYFLKIDVGTGRTGLSYELDFEELIVATSNLKFRGFLAHAGHSYRCRDHHSIQKIYDDSLEILNRLREKYQHHNPVISYGDTPSCSVVNSFEGLHEIRPGNFIFYDWMQYNISSCGFEDIAVCMGVPIVAKHEERDEIVVHGGAVHFSKDYIESNGTKTFGVLARLTKNGWEKMDHDCHLVRVSQEHGILKVTEKQLFNSLEIGQIIGIIPIHSCLAANLMGSYLTLDGSKISQMPKNTVI